MTPPTEPANAVVPIGCLSRKAAKAVDGGRHVPVDGGRHVPVTAAQSFCSLGWYTRSIIRPSENARNNISFQVCEGGEKPHGLEDKTN